MMNFFYLGKSYNSKNVEGTTFKAFKEVNKETKEVTYHPIDMKDTLRDGKVRVFNIGWKKPSKKFVDIPKFNGTTQKEWDEYAKEYGLDCLYYSIDGTNRRVSDCCSYNKQCEFASLQNFGIEQYQEFLSMVEELRTIQRNVFEEKYKPLLCTYHGEEFIMCEFEDKFLFRPSYITPMYGMSMKYYMNPIDDEKRMIALYKDYRYVELHNNHELSSEYDRISDARRNETDQNKKEELHKKEIEISNIIYHDVWNQITSETGLDEYSTNPVDYANSIFPTSVEDKMIFLYGKRAAKIYEKLLEFSDKN